MKKNKALFLGGLFFLALFFVLIYLVKTVDVQAIGPMGSTVGFATINGAVAKLIGTSDAWYLVSKVLGLASFLLCSIFGLVGLIQWIQRKNMFKVDLSILFLGGYYIIVIALYFLFTKIAINYRPVLDEGELACSFPSSHSLLALCVFISAMNVVPRLVKNPKFCRFCKILFSVLLVVAVLSRFLSGVHWLTDILGSFVLSAALLCLFESLNATFLVEEGKRVTKKE